MAGVAAPERSRPAAGFCVDPVFVLCAARSGSSLLRRALDSHPELACPAELNLVVAYEAIQFAVRSANPTDRAAADREATELCRDLAAKSAGQYAVREHKRRWCEKSLPSVDYAEMLSELFPESQFICLYRECTDTIASAIEACPWGFGGYGFDPYVRASTSNFVFAIASYWAEKAELLLAFEEKHPERSVRIRYEDLVCSPEETLTGVFDFLGCSSSNVADLFEAIFARNRELVAGDYKTRFTSGFETSSVGRGWTIPISLIPPPLLQRIEDLHTKLGYPSLQADVSESLLFTMTRESSQNGAGPASEQAQAFADLVAKRIKPRIRGRVRRDGAGTHERPRIKLQLADSEAFVLDFVAGRVRFEHDVEVDCTVLTDTRTLLDLAGGLENPGVALRKSQLRVACGEGSTEVDTMAYLDRLMDLIGPVDAASNGSVGARAGDERRALQP
jgi:protein-tyrosine sulfotransferase